MVSDLIGEEVFQDLVTAVLQDVTAAMLPGSHLAMALVSHASRAFFRVLSKDKKADQQAKLDALVRVPFNRSYVIAAERVAEADLTEDQKLSLVKYLSAIPMTSRQAIHRWDDGGHVTTLVSQLPRTPEQMVRFVPIRPPHFQPGYKIPGYDFRLDTLLGQGGFAEVWKAHNTELDGQPPVALKFCLDEDLLPGLKREIQVLDRLRDYSPEKDFVQLQQTAYSAEPPFLVYEYIDGGNLTSWLDSFEGKAPKPDQVVSVLKMTARAVAVAHDNNIVHRDLKPANLMMTQSGRIKVADFGIGFLMAETEVRRTGGQDAAATDPAGVHGANRPMYRDPMRDPSAAPDPQDDVYAIGVIAYQLLVGSAARRMEGGWQRYLQNSGVPERLIEIVDTCVAPSEQRFKNAGALLAALERPEDGVRPKARKPRTPPRPKKPAAAKFCHQCGARVRAGNRHCNDCGYRYPWAAP